MKKPAQPQSQIQEVLFYLLTRINIDRRQMMLSVGVLNLPESIRQLRDSYGLKIETTSFKTRNKFGREVQFGKYSIKDKKEARDVYNKIQSNGRI